MNCCPVCGAKTKSSGLVVDLNSNTAYANGLSVRLTPRCAELLSLLADGFPAYVDKETLMRRMYGMSGGPETDKNIHVFVSKLRPLMRKIGVGIGSRYHSGGEGRGGYRVYMLDVVLPRVGVIHQAATA